MPTKRRTEKMKKFIVNNENRSFLTKVNEKVVDGHIFVTVYEKNGFFKKNLGVYVVDLAECEDLLDAASLAIENVL